MSDVTTIINRIDSGDQEAAGQLLPLVYEELRKLASSRMNSERANHTLTPTALVHESYLRLVGDIDDNNWDGRGHFFAAAAEAMRRILIDHARQKSSQKRGGGVPGIQLDEAFVFESNRSREMIALDDALKQLEKQDEQTAALVKLRFFGGMTNREAAKYVGLSPRKADMMWAYARAWLQREITDD